MNSQYRDKATWHKSCIVTAGNHFTWIRSTATWYKSYIVSTGHQFTWIRSTGTKQLNLTQIKYGHCQDSFYMHSQYRDKATWHKSNMDSAGIHFTWIRSFTNKVQVIQLKSYKYFLRSIVWLISSTSARCSNRSESYAWTLTQPKLYWFYRQFIGSLNWAWLLWTPVPSRSTCRSRGGDLNWWTPRSRSGRQTKPPLWQ